MARTRKVKVGKLLAVIFLTVLIWVWADLAKTESYTLSHARISIVQTANPDLWVNFASGQSASVEDVVVTGASSRVEKFRRHVESLRKVGRTIEFDLDPKMAGMDEPGNHNLVLRDFLSRVLRQQGLKVESCKPEKLAVTIRRLVKKTLEVRCFDENQNPVEASVDPPQVEIAIPEGLDGTARVQLSATEIRQAKAAAVKKRPFFHLPTGERIVAPVPVDVRLPVLTLQPQTVDKVRPGLVIAVNILKMVLQGKYEIEIENMRDLVAPVVIKASPAAKEAYENMAYQVLLEIYDEDAQSASKVIRRKVKYNFPEEYMRRGEIELGQQPVEARFKLVPAGEATSAAGPTS